MRNFDREVTGIGVLADKVRRQLYRFVCSQTEPVSRDQAAEALGIARHQAKFHLDRLEAEGLLETDYVRLTGRSGPGAGRTAKRYRRGRAEFAVTLPAREYELLGRIMAEAIADSLDRGAPLPDSLGQAAEAQGAAMAQPASRQPSSADAALDLTESLLREHGYEPRLTGRTLILANCPFHALARSHTELVCRINHALIGGLARSVAGDLLEISLQPAENRCCVTVTASGCTP
jgi:predicted ArsR family transcriptional regulator